MIPSLSAPWPPPPTPPSPASASHLLSAAYPNPPQKQPPSPHMGCRYLRPADSHHCCHRHHPISPPCPADSSSANSSRGNPYSDRHSHPYPGYLLHSQLRSHPRPYRHPHYNS